MVDIPRNSINAGAIYADDTTMGLYGVTPVVQPASANQAAVSTSPLPGAAGDPPTQAEFDAVVTRFNSLLVLVDALRTAGVNLGTIKGSA